MNLIITGASGFIGKNLTLAVPKTWKTVAIYHTGSEFPAFLTRHKLKNVTAVSCDLTSPAAVASLAKRYPKPFDACVHLSANGDPALSAREPLLDLNKNTLALVTFLSHIKIKKFIFFSSGAVYDGCQGLVSPSVNVEPVLPYAISKLSSELYIKAFTKKGLINEYVNLRFFGAFGPHEPARKIYSKLVKALYIEKGSEFTVTGNGRNFIDAMYVDDTVDGVLKVINSKRTNLTVDFCSGTPLSINDLVKTAAKVFRREPVKINHQGIVPEYIRFRASAAAMKKIYGFTPQVTLEDGLMKLAQFLEQEGNS